MATNFKSKYTGEQIENILDKANNVTDVTPNPDTVATDTLDKIKIGDTTYETPKPINVEGNPQTDATADLTKITIGDKTYTVRGDIVANPEDEGTEELRRLQIGSTVYSIPSGGGGGATGLYKHTISLYTDMQTIWVDIIDDSVTPFSTVKGVLAKLNGLYVSTIELDPETIYYNCFLLPNHSSTDGVTIFYTAWTPSAINIKNTTGIMFGSDTVTAI